MGQGGAFVELITVRRGAYARRYIQTALKVVAINPRGSPFPVLATRLLPIPPSSSLTRCISLSPAAQRPSHRPRGPSTRYGIHGINWRPILSPALAPIVSKFHG